MSDLQQHTMTGIDNKGLLAIVNGIRKRRDLRDAHLHVGKSSTAGHLPWASPKTLLDMELKAINDLHAKVLELLPPSKYESAAWANVLSRGDWLEEHDHRWMRHGEENAWSATYYVSGDGGELAFEGHPPIKVTDGLCVIFPATLPHSVPYYDGAKDRVCIAFNFRHLSE